MDRWAEPAQEPLSLVGGPEGCYPALELFFTIFAVATTSQQTRRSMFRTLVPGHASGTDHTRPKQISPPSAASASTCYRCSAGPAKTAETELPIPLNKDVLIRIADFLTASDLMSLALTCKAAMKAYQTSSWRPDAAATSGFLMRLQRDVDGSVFCYSCNKLHRLLDDGKVVQLAGSSSRRLSHEQQGSSSTTEGSATPKKGRGRTLAGALRSLVCSSLSKSRHFEDSQQQQQQQRSPGTMIRMQWSWPPLAGDGGPDVWSVKEVWRTDYIPELETTTRRTRRRWWRSLDSKQQQQQRKKETCVHCIVDTTSARIRRGEALGHSQPSARVVEDCVDGSIEVFHDAVIVAVDGHRWMVTPPKKADDDGTGRAVGHHHQHHHRLFAVRRSVGGCPFAWGDEEGSCREGVSTEFSISVERLEERDEDETEGTNTGETGGGSGVGRGGKWVVTIESNTTFPYSHGDLCTRCHSKSPRTEHDAKIASGIANMDWLGTVVRVDASPRRCLRSAFPPFLSPQGTSSLGFGRRTTVDVEERGGKGMFGGDSCLDGNIAECQKMRVS